MGRSGILWQTESYDHIVRDGQEFFHVVNYIHWNPIRKKLCGENEKYPWRWVSEEMKNAGWKPALLGKINYVVWSDVFVCPNCAEEVVFWNAAVDKEAGKVLDEFPCPHCHSALTKRTMQKAFVSVYDRALQKTIRQAKQVPVLINYTANKKRFEKIPDLFDFELIDKINAMDIPYWFPPNELPDGFNTRQPKQSHGITHVHQFYTKTNLWCLCAFVSRLSRDMRSILLPMIWTNTKMYRYRWAGGIAGAGGGPLAGTLYIPSLFKDISILESAKDCITKAIRKKGLLSKMTGQAISCHSSNLILAVDNSVDYIFLDPPFGANINYSELNFMWESWLKVLTNNEPEAIVNESQNKEIADYRNLMTECFKEAHRILKPGRWMTIEFSNTSASVWNNIQTALKDAGFIVANVSALDKKQGSFKAVTTTTAVKQDLIISAYKPNGGFEERFIREAESESGVWDFIRTHLKYLPVAKIKDGKLMTIGERDPRLLFDQLVAYYVRKGYNVPISSQDFQTGLAERFDERDGLYYLPEQAAEYDKRRAGFQPATQGTLFVSDEASAIIWLRQLLKQKTLTFQEINPLFMQELSAWNKYEKTLELSQLLEENFLMYDGKGEVPSQIHTYLSTNWHDLRRLEACSTELKQKAENRWYVPDPNKANDLEKVRDKSLLREFEEYRNATKKLKTFRLEAVRAGFKHAYQERDYATILAIGKKIPEDVLEEDEKLLMWFNQAEMRVEE